MPLNVILIDLLILESSRAYKKERKRAALF
jgi:hypothetical protein